VDRDIQPLSALREGVGDGIELTVGGDADENALGSALTDVEVVFTTSRLPISRRVLEASNLDIVAKFGTGLDNVDVDAASDLGISVTYTPGINALSVAEHALGLLLATLRRTVNAQHVLESGGWRDETHIGRGLSGKTVGIVGYGRIGQRFASLLNGFHTETLAFDPYVQREDAELTGTTLTSLDTLFDRSDAVVVTAELTDETRGLLDDAAFTAMKPPAVVVNVARGAIIDQSALVTALETESIAGAGLDVFESEPLSADSPLHEFEAVTLTPHIAARTEEASVACIDRLATNVLALLDGQDVPARYLAT
jgi:D-3-phosphoglycerate dehydrogenase